ncbi:MAG: outer membrane lipid asymmetry maintenance protein MlaD [Pseudomonadota bacterium]
MKLDNPFETLVGALVVAVAIGFALYATGVQETSANGEYSVIAEFRSAEGVAPGADVRIAGVRVGSVQDMTLNQERMQARVVLSLSEDIQLPLDSSAKIASDGLLGGAYITIDPGVDDLTIDPGGEIEFTQGAVNFIDLIGRAIHTTAGAPSGDQ